MGNNNTEVIVQTYQTTIETTKATQQRTLHYTSGSLIHYKTGECGSSLDTSVSWTG